MPNGRLSGFDTLDLIMLSIAARLNIYFKKKQQDDLVKGVCPQWWIPLFSEEKMWAWGSHLESY